MPVTASASVITAVAFSLPLIVSPNVGTAQREAVFEPVRASNEVILGGMRQHTVYSTGVGQAYFWTERWQQGERAAENDLRSGQFEEFDNVDDALAWLFDDEG